jgi:predicted Rossmann fold flavoprotein
MEDHRDKMLETPYRVAIVGGGAAGYFAAIQVKERAPNLSVVLFEAQTRVLSKVKISGGGRCNVTHRPTEPRSFAAHYPRGQKELLGVFSQFSAEDTLAWFRQRGVALKIENDGRVFPESNQSQSIIDCLQEEVRRLGIEVKSQCRIQTIEKHERVFCLSDGFGNRDEADWVILSTGNHPSGWSILKQLGHTVIPAVPALFTFQIEDRRFTDLSGISIQNVTGSLSLKNPTSKHPDKLEKYSWSGPMLITHWGLSGPMILKLSSLAAPALFACHYQAMLSLDLLPAYSEEAVRETLLQTKAKESAKLVKTISPFSEIPKRFWERLMGEHALNESTWGDCPHKKINALTEGLKRGQYAISGKSLYKDEFVMAGGLDLKEVDLRTMQSKRCPGLFVAGEIINVDGLTGGFNFQNAWSTGFIAGRSIAEGHSGSFDPISERRSPAR